MYKQYLVQTIDYIKANPDMWDQWGTPSMCLEGEPTCFGGILLRIMNIEDPYFCSLPESLYAYLSNSCAFGVRRTLPELERIVDEYQD